MTNRSGALCTGVTNDLVRRAWEDKTAAVPGVTSHYKITRLVSFEETTNVLAATGREKQIKA